MSCCGSVDYNSGKVVQANGIREFQPDPYPIGLNPRLRSVLLKYQGSNPLFAELRKRWNGTSPPEINRLHVGPLGAADQVIDDATRIFEIQKNWRKLIGVEMETYGVYRAVPNHQSRNRGQFRLKPSAILAENRLMAGICRIYAAEFTVVYKREVDRAVAENNLIGGTAEKSTIEPDAESLQ
jgi:hypothetical protein